MYAVNARAPRMLSLADDRAFSVPEDRLQRCTFCGKDLVVLPNDRRGGACFDCLSLLGPTPRPCPECGAEAVVTSVGAACPHCGWDPSRS